jgi:C-terminal peptidase prc
LQNQAKNRNAKLGRQMNAKLYSALFSILLLSQLLWAQNEKKGADTSTLALSTYITLVNDKSCVISLRQYLGCIFSLQKLVSELDPNLSFDLQPENPEVDSIIEFSTKTFEITRKNPPPRHSEPISQKSVFSEYKDKHAKFMNQFEPTYLPTKESKALFVDQTVSYLAQKFKGQITEEHIVAGINSFLAVAKDPHSRFSNKEEFLNEMSGNSALYGLGISISVVESGALVEDVQRGLGAAEADMRKNDIITSVNGRPLSGLSIKKILAILRGEEHSKVDIEIIRDSSILTKVVTRKKITKDDLKVLILHQVFGRELGYIKLRSFVPENACSDVAKSLDLFNQKNLAGAILDLRNNPGGSIDVANCIASLFLGPDKLFVVFENRLESAATYNFRKTPKAIVFKKPLVILINENSASSSELLSGALREHNRAVIVGQTSFGKGSVQGHLFTTDSYLLFGTLGRFYLPSGHSNQSVGVAPHLEAFEKPFPSERELYALREKDLYLFPLESSRIKIPSGPDNLDKIVVSKHCLASRNPAKAFNEAPENSLLKDWQLLTAAAAIGCYDQSLWR